VDRLARRERFTRVFSPYALAAAGILVVFALLFQPRLGPRIAILVGAQLFTGLSGRKVPVLGTLLVILGIVAANLLVPIGRVMVSWGPVRITETALREGIEKAITFEALIYVSKACIRSDLKIPGKLGNTISTALRCYERILETRVKIHRASFFSDLDSVLLSIYDMDNLPEAERTATPSKNRRKTGTLLLIVLAAAAWLPYLLTLLFWN